MIVFKYKCLEGLEAAKTGQIFLVASLTSEGTRVSYGSEVVRQHPGRSASRSMGCAAAMGYGSFLPSVNEVDEQPWWPSERRRKSLVDSNLSLRGMLEGSDRWLQLSKPNSQNLVSASRRSAARHRRR